MSNKVHIACPKESVPVESPRKFTDSSHEVPAKESQEHQKPPFLYNKLPWCWVSSPGKTRKVKACHFLIFHSLFFFIIYRRWTVFTLFPPFPKEPWVAKYSPVSSSLYPFDSANNLNLHQIYLKTRWWLILKEPKKSDRHNCFLFKENLGIYSCKTSKNTSMSNLQMR